MEEESLSNPDLIKNLMVSFADVFYGHMSDRTREQIFKDGLAIELRNIVKKLNDTYPDVTFYFKWQIGTPAQYFREDQYFVGGFDRDIADDNKMWQDDPDVDEHIYRLHTEDIAQIGIILFYVWHRKCDLGHQHRTTRFYYYSMPKITELVGYHLLDPANMTEYVKRYVPNFFY